MIEEVAAAPGPSLDDYASYSHLSQDVRELELEARGLRRALPFDRTVWMVNSTARGGGVAEMLPRQVALLDQLGLRTRWAVIRTERAEFFALTKRIHNLIHGEGDARLGPSDRQLYESVSQELSAELAALVSPGDIVIVHDPQPAAVGALLHRRIGVPIIWRCHIGLDTENEQTSAAWQFLEPWLADYDAAVFTAAEYIPRFMAGRSQVITPSIDPLGDKNRPLSVHHMTGILSNSGLHRAGSPVLMPPFQQPALRFDDAGKFGSAIDDDDIGLLYRPIVTQISRWDRLKGWLPLLRAFALMKREYHRLPELDEMERRRLQITRLVMAGPEPAAVADDPESAAVLEELCAALLEVEPELRRDIALISLPMASARENALIVNALQSCSSIVVQNSLREGFGLTVTEPMWKGIPVLGSPACGIRQQVRDGIEGRLHHDASDPDAVASAMVFMLNHPDRRDEWGRQGQRRVHDRYLVFHELRLWLQVLAQTHNRSNLAPARRSLFSSPKS